MVTFRFYLVSIVAFFLALAVGVMIGSVLDGGIVDSLNDRLAGVETNLDETVAAMDAKNEEIEELDRYIDESAPFTVDGTVAESTAVVFAEPGVDPAPIEDLVERLRQGGAHVEGIVWATERSMDVSRDELTDLIGEAASDADDPTAAMWSWMFSALTAEDDSVEPGSDPETPTTDDPAPETTTTSPDASSAPLDVFDAPAVQSMEGAGLLELTRRDGAEAPGGGRLLVVTVTSTTSTLSDPGAAATAAAIAAADAGIPTVLAEVHVEDGDTPNGELIAAARDGALGDFSTVDDLELVAGRVAVVLAMSDLVEGIRGDYGLGEGVERLVPQWLGP